MLSTYIIPYTWSAGVRVRTETSQLTIARYSNTIEAYLVLSNGFHYKHQHQERLQNAWDLAEWTIVNGFNFVTTSRRLDQNQQAQMLALHWATPWYHVSNGCTKTYTNPSEQQQCAYRTGRVGIHLHPLHQHTSPSMNLQDDISHITDHEYLLAKITNGVEYLESSD